MSVFGSLYGGYLHSKQGFFSDIVWVAKTRAELAKQFKYIVLITVDSSAGLGLNVLDDQRPDVTNGAFSIGQAVALESAGFLQLVEAEFLNGFDEIWFLNKRPSVASAALRVPHLMNLLEYKEEITPPPPFDDLYELMKQEGAVLGMVDGIGLLYITSDASVASEIEELYRQD